MLPLEIQKDLMCDGRSASRICEYWASKLYNLKRPENSSQATYDLYDDEIRVSVRSLTKAGISFQPSKNLGYGRKGTRQDVIDALNAVQYVLVIDLTEYPLYRFIPLRSQEILAENPPASKWGYDRFRKLFSYHYFYWEEGRLDELLHECIDNA